MATRFLHTSDWQIGMKGSGLGRAGSRVAAQRIETLERIFQTARSHDVNLVLACGDLFERNEVDGDTVERVAAIIGSHADVAVHAIPGTTTWPVPGASGTETRCDVWETSTSARGRSRCPFPASCC